MKAYMKLHGDTVTGKKIEIIQKDSHRPCAGCGQWRLAQELVSRDNVDMLVGFGLTPNAMAVAPVATETKPMIIMNAATSVIRDEVAKYIVRVSMTLPRVATPMWSWASARHQARVHGGVRLRPRDRYAKAIHQGFQGRWRRDRRQRTSR